MRYDVLWRHAATEQLFELAITNPKQARRIMIGIRGLGMGHAGDFKKLTGLEEWRLRVGDWRVSVLLSAGIAYINAVNNRQDAY